MASLVSKATGLQADEADGKRHLDGGLWVVYPKPFNPHDQQPPPRCHALWQLQSAKRLHVFFNLEAFLWRRCQIIGLCLRLNLAPGNALHGYCQSLSSYHGNFRNHSSNILTFSLNVTDSSRNYSHFWDKSWALFNLKTFFLMIPQFQWTEAANMRVIWHQPHLLTCCLNRLSACDQIHEEQSSFCPKLLLVITVQISE